MRNGIRKYFIAGLLTTLFIGIAEAQTGSSSSATDQSTPSALAKGVNPLGSYGGSNFDQINLFNGNLSFSIPLVGLGGRGGLGASVVLSYNSKLWRIERLSVENADGKTSTYFLPVYDDSDTELPEIAPGWTIHTGRMVGRQSTWGELKCMPNEDPTRTLNMLTAFTFTAPDGTQYEFRDDLTDGKPFQITGTCNQPLGSRGTKFHSTDGTAATFISDVEIKDTVTQGQIFPNGDVILRDGTRFRIVRGMVKKQTDRNGNVVNFDYYPNSTRLMEISDTLNRKIRIEYNPSPSIAARIIAAGVNGTSRIIEIASRKLGQTLRQGQTLKNVNQLFPDSRIFEPTVQNNFNPFVLTSITLPSGHKWEFQYNSYAEVARVKTPSGGAIEYELPEGGVISRDGPQIFRRVSERKVLADGSMLEGRAVYGDPTIVDNDPAGNFTTVREDHFDATGSLVAATRHRFVGSPLDNYGRAFGAPPKSGYKPWMEGKEIRTVELDNGTPKRTVEYSFEQRAAVEWLTTNPNLSAQPENDPRLLKTETTLNETGERSRIDYEYDGFNNVTKESAFDFNSTKLRETTRAYVTALNNKNYQTDRDIHIRSLVKSETIFNGSGLPETRTEFEYDNYSSDGFHAPLLNRSFDSAVSSTRNDDYGVGWIWRGNATKITAGTGSPDESSTHMQFDIAGNAIKTIRPNAAATAIDRHSVSIEYDARFHFAYPTKTAQKATQADGSVQTLEAESDYDFSTGAILSAKGFNNDETTYSYNDPLDRLTRETRPQGLGKTDYFYSAPNVYPSSVQTRTQLDAANEITSTSYFDGLLKPIKLERTDAGAGGLVISDTKYDSLGRAFLVSNPHRTPANTDTDGWTRTTFDFIGRVTAVSSCSDEAQTQDCTGTVRSQYQGSSVTVTDQADKQRKSVTDALGRLRQVFEPDSSGALSLETRYDYDARGNLLNVVQGEQTRTFIYDALGRLKSAANPESGTVSYTYDKASNLISRRDARGVITDYAYDELNRIRTKSYLNIANTPNVAYFYDNSPLPVTIPFSRGSSLGRLVGVVSGTGPSMTGSFYGYDIGGRITESSQLLDGVHYRSSVDEYNLASLPTSERYHPTNRVIATAYNAAGQAASTANNGTTIADDIKYAASGALEQQRLGNSLYHTIAYNNRLQPKSISLGTAAAGADRLNRVNLEYGYGTLTSADSAQSPIDLMKNNGNLARLTITPGDATSPIVQNFLYDQLNRIILAKEFSLGGNECGFGSVPNQFLSASGDGSYVIGDEEIIASGNNNGGMPKAQSEGEIFFSLDLTNPCLADKDVKLTSFWDVTAELRNSTSSTVVFELKVNGSVGFTRTLTASVDAMGNVATNGRISSLFAIAFIDSQQDGRAEISLNSHIGSIVTVSYRFVTDSTPDPSGIYPGVGGRSIGGFGVEISTGGQGTFQTAWRQDFQYDRYGNRTGFAANDGQVQHTAINSADNRLSDAGFEYDEAGNLTKEPSGSMYVYDGENRMATATVNGAASAYTYDGNGRRVKKSVNGIETLFIYDAQGRLIAEYEGTNDPAAPSKQYIYGPSGLLAVEEFGEIKYLTPDHLGSPRVVTDGIGGIFSRKDFFPFGEEIQTSLGGRSAIQGYGGFDRIRQKFTGYERDDETGLDFAQARYYSSPMGRFMSPDEFTGGPVELFDFAADAAANPTFYADIFDPQSLNKYQYALNNPLRYVDRNGHDPGDPDKNLDNLQTALSAVGFVPVVGDAVDLANAAISAARGDYKDAAINAVAAIPVIGSVIATGGKLAKATKALSKADDVVDTVKTATKEGGDGINEVRRFMSKKELKTVKKEGIKYDPAKGDGIPTTTTNFTPKNQDIAKSKTGARSAQYQVDFNVKGVPKGPTKITKGGLPEYPIKGDLTKDRITKTRGAPK